MQCKQVALTAVLTNLACACACACAPHDRRFHWSLEFLNLVNWKKVIFKLLVDCTCDMCGEYAKLMIMSNTTFLIALLTVANLAFGPCLFRHMQSAFWHCYRVLYRLCLAQRCSKHFRKLRSPKSRG